MPIKPRDIKPGLMINHLGTIYKVQKVKYRVQGKGKTPDTVKVLNPETGFLGEYNVKLLIKHSKIAKGE